MVDIMNDMWYAEGEIKIMEGKSLHEEKVSPAVDVLARILMSLIGGAFLLVPMIVLSFLRNSLVHSLIVTAVFIIVFAILLSLLTSASNQDIVSATAAYSAVLVVLVGVAQPNGS